MVQAVSDDNKDNIFADADLDVTIKYRGSKKKDLQNQYSSMDVSSKADVQQTKAMVEENWRTYDLEKVLYKN